MKFTLSTKEFNYLISKCLNVVSPKATMPILSNMLIEAANGHLSVTATDLTVGIRCSVEASIEEEGSTTLPAKCLAQLARELIAVNVTVSTDSNEITEIVAGASRFRLPGMSGAQFPSLPALEGAKQFSIKQSVLREILSRTAFAVSRDDNLFILTGVLLHVSQGKATFIATDGKRMARHFVPVDVDPALSGSWVIPLKAIEETQRSFSGDEEVTVYLMDEKVAFQTAEATIVSKLLSGDYPDVQKLIPESLDKIVTLHREELTALLRQVALFSGEEDHAARFTFSNGELRLLAASMKVGEGNTSMPVNYHGDALDIAFNPLYFLDVLKHSKGETVSLGISDPFNPGVVTEEQIGPTSAAEASSLFILMPLRLEDAPAQ